MKYRSTAGQAPIVSAAVALFQGLAADGGLFLPVELPKLPASFFSSLSSLSLPEIGYNILYPFFSEDIPASDFRALVEDCFSFPAPLVPIGKGDSQRAYALELFHGPTLAFKDFGARFLARALGYLRRNSNRSLTVLVATSGDTGGAVAHGFYRVPGISVVILYPSGQVSPLQEKQLTTLGENITALEIQGTFDDCQSLVKQAFLDRAVSSKLELTSANSINIGRLLPQATYYFSGYAQAAMYSKNIVCSVPSGNLGNLTAGVIARFMGLPIKKFILAANANQAAVRYIQTGDFAPHPSVRTCSNAMDVGNPSNLVRLQDLFSSDYQKIQQLILAESFSDKETKEVIGRIYQQHGYLLDPHGAVGYLGWENFHDSLQAEFGDDTIGVILETAHPAKFLETVMEATGSEPKLPAELQALNEREKRSVVLGKGYQELQSFLLSRAE